MSPMILCWIGTGRREFISTTTHRPTGVAPRRINVPVLPNITLPLGGRPFQRSLVTGQTNTTTQPSRIGDPLIHFRFGRRALLLLGDLIAAAKAPRAAMNERAGR